MNTLTIFSHSKKHSQSSNYHTKDGLSKNAVDGNVDPKWYGGSVTHTHSGTKAWWDVDLKDYFMIKEVKIYNYQEVSDRLDNSGLIIMDNSK